MSDDPKCVAGCVPFYGGEKRHHKDCPYYPESLTKFNADRIEELEAKLSESEALLAKAVEALERIEDASKYFGNCPEASETTVRYAHETTRRLARTTLAELTSSVAADNEVKGGKDE